MRGAARGRGDRRREPGALEPVRPGDAERGSPQDPSRWRGADPELRQRSARGARSEHRGSAHDPGLRGRADPLRGCMRRHRRRHRRRRHIRRWPMARLLHRLWSFLHARNRDLGDERTRGQAPTDGGGAWDSRGPGRHRAPRSRPTWTARLVTIDPQTGDRTTVSEPERRGRDPGLVTRRNRHRLHGGLAPRTRSSFTNRVGGSRDRRYDRAGGRRRRWHHRLVARRVADRVRRLPRWSGPDHRREPGRIGSAASCSIKLPRTNRARPPGPPTATRSRTRRRPERRLAARGTIRSRCG